MKRIFLKNYRRFPGLFLLALLVISCEEILLEYDLSEEEIELLAPFDGAELSPSDISFRWGAIDGVAEYELQIAKPGFDQPEQIIFSEFLEDNFFTTSLPQGSYQWRVRALNSSYATAFNMKSFSVENDQEFSSRRVNLFSPSDDLVTNQYAQEFKWDTIEGATLYRFQVYEDNLRLAEEVTSGGSLNYSLPNGSFSWKVRAENDTQNTFYSERSILIDTISPNKAVLIKPEDEAALSNNTINFEWNVPGDSSQTVAIEIDSIYIYKDLQLEELVEKSQGINHSFSDILDRGNTYYWFVTSYDQAGNVSDRSEVFSFKIN